MMNFESKEVILAYITNYHCLLKVEAEMEQFMEGLQTLGVHALFKGFCVP